jgi:hypothetical protein
MRITTIGVFLSIVLSTTASAALAAVTLAFIPDTAHADFVRHVAEYGDGNGSAESPYGQLGQALEDIAAYRLAGGEDHAKIVASGTFVEQLHFEAGKHDDTELLCLGTEFKTDEAGRPLSVALDGNGDLVATTIAYPTASEYGQNYVIWVDQTHGFTIEGCVVAAQFGAPLPTIAVAIDRAIDVVVRDTAATGGFLGFHNRGSRTEFDQVLAYENAIGISVEGGLPGEEGVAYVHHSTTRDNGGHGIQISAHSDVTTPVRLPDDRGIERNRVTITDTQAIDNVNAGFNIIANLPYVPPVGGNVSRSENPAHQELTIMRSSADGGLLGLRLYADNFGYSNLPEHGDAGPVTMFLSLEDLSLFGTVATASAGAFGSPSLRVHVDDPSGAAADLVDNNDFLAPSQLFYNHLLISL